MRQPKRGFTLIELMITIAVLAIVVVISLPALRDFVIRNRMSAQTNGLISALNYARAEGVARSSSVFVCPGNADGTACLSGADAWADHESLIAFNDENSDGAADPDELLRAFEALDETDTEISAQVSTLFIQRVDGEAAPSESYSANLIGFNNFGRLVLLNGSGDFESPSAREQLFFSFVYTPGDDSDQNEFPNRCVHVSATGRASAVGRPYTDNPEPDAVVEDNLWQACQEAS